MYEDPWKIKKVLTASDLGKLNRLLLDSDSKESLVTAGVRVWDMETKSMHELVMKRWASFKNCVLIGDWNQDFVKRRGLKKGDQIGLHWDSCNNCFNFSVLKRA
ncbi:B3 domain-containing protein [Senna tora]|uniref:B3 domain-containing protein n=1 Tax=Senna tora TaxID=362788 RepID=A0A835CK22_9FABA|nr:B3 domain-containing protein [Senna tora]